MQRTLLILAIVLAGVISAFAAYSYGRKTARPAVEQIADVQPAPAEPKVLETPKPVKAAKPAVISRVEWKAKPTRGDGKGHTINCITIHHTGMPMKPNFPIEKKLQNLQSYSQSEATMANGKTKPAWLDVPYHFYISIDGKIAEGRPITIVSDTNTEYDPTRHATIVVEGNFENEDPTEDQMAALHSLVAWLAAEYKVPADRIKAHNDYAKTICPGVNLKKLMPEIRERITP